MKSAEEVLLKYMNITGTLAEHRIVQAMREYAAQAITEQLEVAAKEATAGHTYPWTHNEPYVKKASITSCTRIPLP